MATPFTKSYAVATTGYLILRGPILDITTDTVTITVESAQARYSRTDHTQHLAGQTIILAREGCDLYR